MHENIGNLFDFKIYFENLGSLNGIIFNVQNDFNLQIKHVYCLKTIQHSIDANTHSSLIVVFTASMVSEALLSLKFYIS